MSETDNGGTPIPPASEVGPAPESGQAPRDVSGLIAQLEALLDEYMVAKAPFAIPAGGKEFIVKISPYLIIIFGVMAIPIIVAGLGLTAIFAPFALLGASSFGVFAFIGAIVALITLVMELMAVPGLFNRTKKGWRLVFYASIVSLIGNILSFNILGGILGAIIGWYILFQVKEIYKN